jgi:hypothetical protein
VTVVNWPSLIKLTGAVSLLVIVALGAFAGESRALYDMRISAQHALAAAEAQDLQQVRGHLQQALNCLVGRGGGEYRPSAGDPCKGASALRDLPAGSVNKIRVQKAIRLAAVGITFHGFKPAHSPHKPCRLSLKKASRVESLND